ncbi:MAG: hypothetical protein ACTSRU_12690 [Candidatus Hodarchaeales archaeon]
MSWNKPEFKRDALCPKCGQPMQLIQARSHWFFKCFNLGSFHSTMYGILNDPSNFLTRRVVDPVDMSIVDNPRYKDKSVKRKPRKPNRVVSTEERISRYKKLGYMKLFSSACYECGYAPLYLSNKGMVLCPKCKARHRL